MKKLTLVLLAAILALGLCACGGSDRARLAEYRQMLDEVNQEYGTTLTIQEEDEELFLDTHEGMSLEEVRQEVLLALYRQVLDEVNQEYGTTLTIQEEDEDLFLDTHQGMSLEEVRQEVATSVENLLEEENRTENNYETLKVELQVEE